MKRTLIIFTIASVINAAFDFRDLRNRQKHINKGTRFEKKNQSISNPGSSGSGNSRL